MLLGTMGLTGAGEAAAVVALLAGEDVTGRGGAAFVISMLPLK